MFAGCWRALRWTGWACGEARRLRQESVEADLHEQAAHLELGVVEDLVEIGNGRSRDVGLIKQPLPLG